ncbi:Pre-mRNA-processing ATP-dependent RNA helicase PRP5 [Thelohanellus kitauei]|uniref:Pre-mRNA-processing ATP-dependent RNA helicase PRP5 n=1 Tax=Thelohanellus kitauei TaxID=669202 RepID=A0A0C2MLH8_THEKT|nr:Pre-mRNA-processing ATP-dependent RNA helicase PRP5 [Thelohanellus kitauei]
MTPNTGIISRGVAKSRSMVFCSQLRCLISNHHIKRAFSRLSRSKYADLRSKADKRKEPPKSDDFRVSSKTKPFKETKEKQYMDRRNDYGQYQASHVDNDEQRMPKMRYRDEPDDIPDYQTRFDKPKKIMNDRKNRDHYENAAEMFHDKRYNLNHSPKMQQNQRNGFREPGFSHYSQDSRSYESTNRSPKMQQNQRNGFREPGFSQYPQNSRSYEPKNYKFDFYQKTMNPRNNDRRFQGRSESYSPHFQEKYSTNQKYLQSRESPKKQRVDKKDDIKLITRPVEPPKKTYLDSVSSEPEKFTVQVQNRKIYVSKIETSHLNLSEPIMDFLEQINYQELSDIQKISYFPIQSGRSVFICSKTGSGKTMAYLLPLLTNIVDSSQNVQPEIDIESNTEDVDDLQPTTDVYFEKIPPNHLQIERLILVPNMILVRQLMTVLTSAHKALKIKACNMMSISDITNRMRIFMYQQSPDCLT